MGYEVQTAASGEDAVARTERAEPEIILLDLQLPGMDGLDTLKAIRARIPAAEIIMLTGHGSIDTAIESIRVGAFDYVIKAVSSRRAADTHSESRGAAFPSPAGEPPGARADPSGPGWLLHWREPGVSAVFWI